MGTLHCALENGADLYVNECQKIRDYRARSTEERRRIRRKYIEQCQIPLFFYFARCVRKLALCSAIIFIFIFIFIFYFLFFFNFIFNFLFF